MQEQRAGGFNKVAVIKFTNFLANGSDEQKLIKDTSRSKIIQKYPVNEQRLPKTVALMPLAVIYPSMLMFPKKDKF